MKYLFLIFILTSCAVKYKESKKADNSQDDSVRVDSSLKVKKIEKPENWADSYYRNTIFHLKNPVVLERKSVVKKVCKTETFNFKFDYQGKNSNVQYHEVPLTFKTKSGFFKKVYVSKGACRELTLMKDRIQENGVVLRTGIKEAKIKYIYNFGSYLDSIVFKTRFQDVEFIVN